MSVPEPDARFRAAEQALRSRWPETRIEPSLDRIEALTDLLGRPQAAYPVIHVAGTNGKTSTARMIDALLRELGLRTGVYTSPHLESVTERINVDGAPVSEERFAELYEEVAPYVDLVDADQEHPMSFFEVVTAMAFAAFADAPVEVAVVETGMGGTWDATNVADGAVAVVLPIAMDHADYLGDALDQVAGEKAGIIKAGAQVVLAAQPPEAAAVLLARAAEQGASVAQAGVDFHVRRRDVAVGGQLVDLQGTAGRYDEIVMALHGEHQAENAAVAVAAVEAFIGSGTTPLEADAVRDAFGRVGSPGRLEVLRRSPTVLVDAAHNPAGAQVLARSLTTEFSFTRLVGVVAVMEDKDARGMLGELEPVLAHLVVTRNSSPRGLDPAELAEVAEGIFGADRVTVAHDLPEAIDVGVAIAEEDELLSGTGVVVTGSVVTVGDARTLLGGDR